MSSPVSVGTTPTTLDFWLALSLAATIKPATRLRFLEQFDSPASAALAVGASSIDSVAMQTPAWASEHPPVLNQRLQAALNHRDTHRAIKAARAWAAESAAHHLIAIDDPRYPARLAMLRGAPLVLYVRGNASVLADPGVAIVGARRATPAAKQRARGMAKELADTGLGIISGLAHGVDAAAHQGALDAKGVTIAVAATAPDQTYPPEHVELAEAIAENGAVITEFPLGSVPRPAYFPQRNRVISGLSLGVLVVEAAIRSGTLSTARHASEQGREVMALPGSVDNPLARGCHALIRDGAALVETTADILTELTPALSEWVNYHTDITAKTLDAGLPNRPQSGPRKRKELAKPSPSGPEPSTLPRPDGVTSVGFLPASAEPVLEALGFDPASADTVVTRSRLAVADVLATLAGLEAAGVITSLPGGRYVRTTPET